jgi:hypothetical protein
MTLHALILAVVNVHQWHCTGVSEKEEKPHIKRHGKQRKTTHCEMRGDAPNKKIGKCNISQLSENHHLLLRRIINISRLLEKHSDIQN